MSKIRKALALVDGGILGAVGALWMKSLGFEVTGLAVFTGGNPTDMSFSSLFCESYGFPLVKTEVNLGEYFNEQIGYVPARNLVLASIGVSVAESIGALDIFMGFCKGLDYPDVSKKFFSTMGKVAGKCTETGRGGRFFRFRSFLDKSFDDVIDLGIELGLDFEKTHSCYVQENSSPCRKCEGCIWHKEVLDVLKAGGGEIISSDNGDDTGN